MPSCVSVNCTYEENAKSQIAGRAALKGVPELSQTHVGPCAAQEPVSVLKSPLAKSSRDVVLRSFFRGTRKNACRRAKLDETAFIEERRLVAHPRCLLHVVRHDYDRVIGAQLADQIFDARRAGGVER